MKISLRLLAILTLSVSGGGCGLIYHLSETRAHKEVRKSGYELCHLESCGPQALSDAFSYFDINKTPLEIGKEIQDDDNIHYRGALSFLHHDFCKITCPPELLKFCKKHNFIITKEKSLEKLDKNAIAIILIRGKDTFWDWHWTVYPKYDKSHISTFFEGETKIKGIYILNEKEKN